MLVGPVTNLEIIFLGICFFWLLILTFYLTRAVRHYQKLTYGIDKRDLRTVLENLLGEVAKDDKRIAELVRTAEEIKKGGLLHIQKVGLVRFNPFKDTGGDQSFVLALLDGEKSGVVISSLHSRTGTRIYAKPVTEGEGEKYELSQEEKEAIKEAIGK